ncbi:MAG: outer membrane protein assembly factor BamB family protein [Planctomycetota bacterium]|jgi:hypothetical protein
MRIVLTLLFLMPTLRAGEHDGGSARATRWNHPRGPASRSCMSWAKAPQSLGPAAWTYKANPPISAVPLTWDGVAYLQQNDQLVAIDTQSGKRLASHKVGVAAGAAVEDGAVYLRLGARIVQWRRRGAAFSRRWSAEVGADASAPCLYDGELYLTTAGKLVRFRPGSDKPVWSVGTQAHGAPALYGEQIYALEGKAVVARSRLDGKEVARIDLGLSGKNGLVAVNVSHVVARIGTQWIIARRVMKDGKLELSRPWKVPYAAEPLVYRNSTIGRTSKENNFTLFGWKERTRKQKDGPDKKFIAKDNRELIKAKQRVDLIDGAGLPISLNDWFCTGLWCANLNANRIVWHLQERPDRVLLKEGVAFRPVPADDESLMVISKDAKKIICLRPEVIGQ